MKKLFFLLCLFAATTCFAQTEEETLEWMNVNKVDFSTEFSISDFLSGGIKKIDQKSKETYILVWTAIKEIRTSSWKNYERTSVLLIDSSGKAAGELVLTGDLHKVKAEKYEKAIEHMVKLKGGKLIKKDLF